MSGFWFSDLGPITGKTEDIYGKKFTDIPDGTTAIAKIISFKNADGYLGIPVLKTQWQIRSEDFNNRQVFQNIKVFDSKPETRRKALNILMLLYRMYDMNPQTEEAPTDKELSAFEGRLAGIKIGLYVNQEKGTASNFVSEIHPVQDFVCEVGLESVRAPAQEFSYGEGHASNNPRNKQNNAEFEGLDNDIPF